MSNLQLIYQKFVESRQKVCTDTRKEVKGSFFVCLKGENFDANEMVEKALELGAKYVLCERKDLRDNRRIIYSENALQTLTNLSTHHRKKLNTFIIAIGGSNGKTTTKELLGSIFSNHAKTLVTPGNFNNHIGVPLTLLQLEKHHQFGIVELGINHPKEMEMLCKIALPDEGALTNIGKEHLEGFGDIEGVAKAESEIFQYLLENDKLAYINTDDVWIKNMSKRLKKVVNFGHSQLDQLGIVLHDINPKITISIDGLKIQSSLGGDYNLSNIICSIAIARHHNVSIENVKEGIESYEPTNNRSQWVQTEKNTVLMDCYNANPTSMSLAMNNFLQIEKENKVCILGDMLEMGENARAEHMKIIEEARLQSSIAKFIFVGDMFYSLRDLGGFSYFKNALDLKQVLSENSIYESTLLLKASRGIKLEQILDKL